MSTQVHQLQRTDHSGGGIENGGGHTCVEAERSLGNFCAFPWFYCEPKTALRNKICLCFFFVFLKKLIEPQTYFLIFHFYPTILIIIFSFSLFKSFQLFYSPCILLLVHSIPWMLIWHLVPNAPNST